MYDFSLIDRPAANNGFNKKHVKYGVIFFGFLVANFIILLLFRAPVIEVIKVALIITPIALFSYTAGIKGLRIEETKVLNREDVAKVNGFNYQKAIKDFAFGPGSLFTCYPSIKDAEDVYQGNIGGLPFSLFTCGKERTTVFKISLPRSFPHMVVDSLIEEGEMARRSVLPIRFDSSQNIGLEGDFSRYFSAYAPAGYATELLRIIAPDVMWVLMRTSSKCDIEIIDNQIYFYWSHKLMTTKQYEEVFATVDSVMRQIGPKLTKEDLYVGENGELKSGYLNYGQGVKLEEGFRFTPTLVVAISVFSVIALLGKPDTGATIAVCVLILGYCIQETFVKKYKNNKLKERLKQD